MKLFAKTILSVALCAGVAAAPAAAQAPEQRINVTFTPAFATVGGDTETALSGSVGYRFTQHLSFEGDFTWIDAAAGGVRNRQFGLDGLPFTTTGVSEVLGRTSGMFGGRNRLPSFNLGNISNIAAIPIRAGDFSAAVDGQTLIGTLGVRFEPLVQTARFRPYVSGGLGLNHTEQELTVDIATITRAFDESVSHSGFAFSAGGGANIRLFSSVWANADAKYFRLSRDRNIMRLGGGIGLRF